MCCELCHCHNWAVNLEAAQINPRCVWVWYTQYTYTVVSLIHKGLKDQQLLTSVKFCLKNPQQQLPVIYSRWLFSEVLTFLTTVLSGLSNNCFVFESRFHLCPVQKFWLELKETDICFLSFFTQTSPVSCGNHSFTAEGMFFCFVFKRKKLEKLLLFIKIPY